MTQKRQLKGSFRPIPYGLKLLCNITHKFW